MASFLYNSFKRDSMLGVFNLTSDTIKIALVTNSYIADIDNHTKFSDVTGEVVGAGYTQSGSILAAVTLLTDNTNDRVVLDASDVSWTSSSITSNAAILYKAGATPETSPLIAYIDFGSDKSSSNGDFIIQWNMNGIIALT